MIRKPNTDVRGSGFASQAIHAVWQRGVVVAGYDAAAWRKDACGAWIKRTDFGLTTSAYGWEVDHVLPVALGGGDQLANLQPLQWANNRHKADQFPHWTCKVRAA